jgi:hypothetical protein
MIQYLYAASCDTILPDLYKGLRTADCAELKPIASFDAITVLLANAVQIALTLAGLLAVGFIIFGAVQYIMSQGQPDRIKKAKETIVNAVIGLFLAILAFVIVALIANGVTGRLT